MTATVKILQDFLDIDTTTGEWVLEDDEGNKALEPGTLVDAEIREGGVAWYKHPVTGEAWATPPGLFEVVEEAN